VHAPCSAESDAECFLFSLPCRPFRNYDEELEVKTPNVSESRELNSRASSQHKYFCNLAKRHTQSRIQLCVALS